MATKPQSQEPPASPAEPDPAPGDGAASVLVITDDPELCPLLTATLRDAGYHPLVAYTAISGLAQARDRQPDLILLDLSLPDLDGLALLGRLAADSRTVALPVLVISESTDAVIRKACCLAGARAVIPKPLDPGALLELVRANVAAPAGARLLGTGPRDRWESVLGQGISRLVHADLDTGRVCQAVVEGAVRLVGLTAASLWLLDGDALELRFQSSMFESATRRSHTRIPVGEGLIGVVALEHRPVATADAARDPRVMNRTTFETLGLRAFLAVPLLHDGRLLGVLSGARTTARPFATDDLHMLEALADHAAAVLDQARLLQESERRRRTAEALAALATEVSGAQSPAAILERVLDYVQQLIAADVSYLDVIDPDAGVPPLMLMRGARGRALQTLVPTEGQGIAGWVMARGRPLRTADYLTEPRISHDFDDAIREEEIRAALAVPVRLNGEVVGALGAMRRDARPFTDDDERVLEQLAAQAAVALGNVWLYREVARAKQQWETTVNHLHDGLALLDSDLRILRINRALAGWIGKDPEGLVGRALGEILPVYATAAGQARLAAARAERSPRAATIEEGGRVLEETLAPVAEAGGAPVGLVVALRDVTEARRLQGQLLTAEKLASLGEMLAGVAHELNNPLAGILGFAQLLEARVMDPAQREDLQKLAREAQRAARLVQHLLRFARQHPPERQPTDLNALVQTAVELLAGPCRGEGIAIEADLAEGIPVTFADPHQLQQAVVNLATNARQAMAAAGRGGRIRLSTRRDGEWLELRVTDEGPGIRPDVLSRIFDPFFTTKAPGEGTGLGLSVCHSIVTGHGGDIWVESVPDRGVTVHIRLPIVPPPPPDAGAAPAPIAPERAGAPSRVLVAEDEPTLRDLVLEALLPRGHAVDVVGDGAAALERLRAAAYDVLLLDLRMPGVDGRETIERLRVDPPASVPRIVLMTGDGVRPETRSWLDRTGLPVLGKPFALEALVSAVEGEAPRPVGTSKEIRR